MRDLAQAQAGMQVLGSARAARVCQHWGRSAEPARPHGWWLSDKR